MSYSEFTIQFEVSTPFFISGLEQNHSEFQLSSFKGALRFWWRTLALTRYNNLCEIKKAEESLFGGSSAEIGKSKLVLTLNEFSPNERNKHQINFAGLPGIIYLGYGLIHYSGRAQRKYFTPPCTGSISIYFKKDTFSHKDKKNFELFKESIKALSLFGGLGSRTRRGFGSFNITKLTYNNEQIMSSLGSIGELKKELEEFCSKNKISVNTSYPQYSAFSKYTRIDILEHDKDPIKLLDEIGCRMLMYRSWGRYGKVLGRKSEKNFKFDHDLIVFSRNLPEHPKRVVFGLPHNYFISSRSKKVSIKAENYERRSSPLFLKIKKLDHSYAVISLILRSTFLPKGEKIEIGHSKLVNQNVDWGVLTDFIDAKNRFPNKITVFK
ncbi:MAG: type III-B CRISPR module RAMP protein Cmr1 [Candidatus Hodarchaeales archaeon]